MEAQVVQDLAADSSEVVWDDSELSHEEWEGRRKYIPVWRGRLHGFHDYGKAATQDMVDILDKHLPRMAKDWHCQADCFHFRCDDLKLLSILPPTKGTSSFRPESSTATTLYLEPESTL
jgi:hypothetical protein